MGKTLTNFLCCLKKNKIEAKLYFGVIILSFLGIFFIFISFYFQNDNDLLFFVINHIGIALIVGAIVALLIEKVIHARYMEIYEKNTDSLFSHVDVLQGAINNGVVDIFSRRGEKGARGKQKIFNIVAKQLSKNEIGEIKIMGISGSDFFKSKQDYSERNYLELFDDYLNNSNPQVTIKVLLLNPDSKAGKLWTSLEHLSPSRENIEKATGIIQKLTEGCTDSQNIIQYRYYNEIPRHLLIITSNYIFIEPYPLFSVSISDGSLGGKSPMMVIRKGNESDKINEGYSRWNKTFDYYWENNGGLIEN